MSDERRSQSDEQEQAETHSPEPTFGWKKGSTGEDETNRRQFSDNEDSSRSSTSGQKPTGYWAPPRPGELPSTIIKRQQYSASHELVSRFGKPAMLGLTIAAVSTSGIWQAAQASVQDPSSSESEDSASNFRTAPTEDSAFRDALAMQEETTSNQAVTPRSAPIIYTVVEGDEVRNIARHFGLHTMTIVWNNVLPDPDLIHPDQQLLIPPVDGMLIEVQPGDSLRELATQFGVSVTAIVNFEPNGITDPDLIHPGQILMIPGGTPPAAIAGVEQVSQESSSASATSTESQGFQTTAVEFTGEVVVEPGDTLAGLAQRFGVTAAELAQANQIADVDMIFPGTVLNVPEGETAEPHQQATHTEPAPPPPPTPEAPVASVPEPQTQPDPTPAPAPDPAPVPQPTPTPAPAPEPTPAPAPQPTPAPEPDPQPEPDASGPPADIPGLLEYWAIQYNLDPNLVKAVAWQESRWNQNVVSYAGAQGVMQIMPGTGVWINNNLVSGTLNISGSASDNIQAGSAYLRHMIDITGGTVERGLAAYFSGPGTVQTVGITASAQRYVDGVLEVRDYIARHGEPPR